MNQWRFDAIGTVWTIDTATPLSAPQRERVADVIDGFDRTWSRFRADSTVTALAPAGGTVAVPADAAPMLDIYRELSAATNGAINPLVGASLASLGYDGAYSLTGGIPTPAPDWEQQLRWDDLELSLASAATIDVGALGKGRLVDRVFHALADVDGALTVDAGGDMRFRGFARVALEHPYDETRAIGIATLTGSAICASATSRRAWGDGLHHVLDARTGIPVRTWAATWAIADDTMTADAAATALFFDGGPELVAGWNVEWVRMSTDGRAQHSAHAPVELFTVRA